MFRKARYYYLKSRRDLHRKGLLFVLEKIIKKIKYTIFGTTASLWFCRELDQKIDAVGPGIDVKIEFLGKDKNALVDWLIKYRDRFPWIYIHEEIATAGKNGHIFIVILHENGIVGYVKIGFGHAYVHDFDKVVRLPPEDALIYDTFVLPEFRGKKLALYAVTQAMRFLSEKKDLKRVWCHIEEWNRASLKVYEKAGFKMRGRVRFCRISGTSFFIIDRYRLCLKMETFLSTPDDL